MMKKSFTLIELLVVIAIIAILAGMLLPALNTAREKGRAASCTGNVKQISNGIAMYTDAYDGYYPTSETATDLLVAQIWSDVVLPYLGVDSSAYYKRDGLFICPTQKNIHTSWRAYISYGINRDFVGRENYTKRQWADDDTTGGRKNSSIKQPTQQMITAETWYVHTKTQMQNCGSTKVPARTLGNYAVTHDSIAFRHSRKNNALYADGHVSADDQAWLWMSHPSYLPWNAGNKKSTFLVYPGRKSWEEERGYDPYY